MPACYPAADSTLSGYSTIPKAKFESNVFRLFGVSTDKMKCGDEQYARLRISGITDEYGLHSGKKYEHLDSTLTGRPRTKSEGLVQEFFGGETGEGLRGFNDARVEAFHCGWDGKHECPGANAIDGAKVAFFFSSDELQHAKPWSLSLYVLQHSNPWSYRTSTF